MATKWRVWRALSVWAWVSMLASANSQTVAVSYADPSRTAPVSAVDVCLSADGSTIAFASSAMNLSVLDTNGVADVFVKRVGEPFAVLVSNGPGGAPASGPSRRPSLSADGRYVAFESDADNLVAGDVNGQADVFVWDMQSGAMLAASSVASVPVGGTSPSLSSDGRYVAFVSATGDLDATDWNGLPDVFVVDLQNGAKSRVSVGPGGIAADGASEAPSISADGAHVAFASLATNLVPGDQNGLQDVFVRDLAGQTTVRASVADAGAEADGPSWRPSLGATGRWVAFESAATNIGFDANATTDVFVRDLASAVTLLASRSAGGAPGDQASRAPRMLGTGEAVVFLSGATNLVPSDTNGRDDAFAFVLADATLSRVALGSEGTQLGAGVSGAWPSQDGGKIAYLSASSPVSGPNPSGASGPYLRDVASGDVVRADGALPLLADGSTLFTSISGDGRLVAFDSEARNVYPHAPGYIPVQEVYVRDTWTGQLIWARGLQGVRTTDFAPSLSADGAWVALTSWPVAGQPSQVVARRLADGASVLVSSSASGAQGNGYSMYPKLSPDGRFAAFISGASNLVPGDANHIQDAFLKDLRTGAVELLSPGHSGQQADGLSAPPAITPDGRFATFASFATNLVEGDTNGQPDIFVRDIVAGTTERLTRASGGGQTDATSYGPSISAEGRYVAYASQATNLVPNDVNGVADIFVVDRWTGATECVSPGIAGAGANGASFGAHITANGRFIAFSSEASNLVEGDANGVIDAFLFDRTTREVRRLPLDLPSGPNGATIAGGLSLDGRYASLQSDASNLGLAAKFAGVRDAWRTQIAAAETVFIVGRVSLPDRRGPMPELSVTIYPQTGAAVTIDEVPVGPLGEFGVTAPFAHVVGVAIKAGTYLRELDSQPQELSVGLVMTSVFSPLNGDCNDDNRVDLDDFLILAANYETHGIAGDLDGDGWVGLDDFLILAANYGSEGE